MVPQNSKIRNRYIWGEQPRSNGNNGNIGPGTPPTEEAQRSAKDNKVGREICDPS